MLLGLFSFFLGIYFFLVLSWAFLSGKFPQHIKSIYRFFKKSFTKVFFSWWYPKVTMSTQEKILIDLFSNLQSPREWKKSGVIYSHEPSGVLIKVKTYGYEEKIYEVILNYYSNTEHDLSYQVMEEMHLNKIIEKIIRSINNSDSEKRIREENNKMLEASNNVLAKLNASKLNDKTNSLRETEKIV